MTAFANSAGKPIIMGMIKTIQDNKAYLGEVDGLIGDGDHGMNMNKGFSMFEEQFGDLRLSFTGGLDGIGLILLNKIGGSMGPIYGAILLDMAEEGAKLDFISAQDFINMLEAGIAGLSDIVEARPGDKTLIDVLYPAIEAMKNATAAGADFAEALAAMKVAAEKGRDSTKDMVAKFGRSSRLGERSRGVLDAGAVSCCLLLSSMADGITALLR